ncbi:MAG: adenine phosphoribosyltransferase [Ignavibacteriales bacterium]|nr:MAG: adenine phosphoribosyltransferase [Ignavibacteriales bacterium]
MLSEQELKKLIRSVPDFPKKGIMFRDITTLIKDKQGLSSTLEQLLAKLGDKKIDKVVGIESRGFIFGALLAEKLGVGFVPVRKPGKLPAEKITESYSLEYGQDSIEIHSDSIEPRDKVLIHDDLLATGGTMEAACKLIEKLKGEIVQVSFIVELTFLNGREKLNKYDVSSLISYADEN